MNLKELQNYRNWVGKSPQEILDAVKHNHGWSNIFYSPVFPKGLPIWAHRIRNYFNREPIVIMRLDEKQSMEIVRSVLQTVNPEDEGWFDKKKRWFSLSGDVYWDGGSNKYWLQMDAGATIYHFKTVTNQTMEGLDQSLTGQSKTPIFKLIASDGSGGSCETIIINPLRLKSSWVGSTASGGDVIGEVGLPVPVSHLVLKNYQYQGSYNYAETTKRGFKAHSDFDIEPHENPKYKMYENPPDRFAPLSSRRFPKYAKGEEGKTPLAEQIYPN